MGAEAGEARTPVCSEFLIAEVLSDTSLVEVPVGVNEVASDCVAGLSGEGKVGAAVGATGFVSLATTGCCQSRD